MSINSPGPAQELLDLNRLLVAILYARGPFKFNLDELSDLYVRDWEDYGISMDLDSNNDIVIELVEEPEVEQLDDLDADV